MRLGTCKGILFVRVCIMLQEIPMQSVIGCANSLKGWGRWEWMMAGFRGKGAPCRSKWSVAVSHVTARLMRFWPPSFVMDTITFSFSMVFLTACVLTCMWLYQCICISKCGVI